MILLETDRLIIGEANRKDSSFFFKLLNSPNWIKHIGDRGIGTRADALNYIENSLIGSYQENGFGLYKVCLRDSLIPVGICGFLQRDYLSNPDIGFAILPKYEGSGYTCEAASATLEFGFKSLGFTEICGITTENNIGSRKVLAKIGMKEVKKIKPNGEELILFSNLTA